MVCYSKKITKIAPPSDHRPGPPELLLFITNQVKDKPRQQRSFRATIHLWNTNRIDACNYLLEILASLGINRNCRRPMIREIERRVGQQLEAQPDETAAFRVEIITMGQQRSAPSAGEGETSGGGGGGCGDEGGASVWGTKRSHVRIPC